MFPYWLTRIILFRYAELQGCNPIDMVLSMVKMAIGKDPAEDFLELLA